jgi:23S rRNA (uracil1939-C5)-methyltransferase
MALIETGKCKIEKLSSKGFGVGKTEMGLVELPYLLPGDEVEFERHAYRGSGNCLTKSVKEGDYPRSVPPCEYFGQCGGCLLQHLTEEDYAKIKLSMITNALSARGITDYKLNPIITIPSGNRRRANIEAIKRQGELYFGFHAFGSFRITDIRKCIALEPELSDLLEPLRAVIDKVIEDRQKAQLFLTKAANGIDLWLEIQNVKELTQAQRKLLEEFALTHNIIRLIFRHRKYQDVIHQTEEPYILFDDVRVAIDAQCFLQSSSESDRILGELVLDYCVPSSLRDKGCINAIDLFCGRGTYTLPLSKYCKIDGYESDKGALSALGAAANDSGRKINLFRKDLFTSPVLASDLKKYDFCVVNPPRAGAESQIKELAKVKNLKICYVSCNPETFARDAKELIKNGYKLKEISPVDQFYWAPHLEIVGYFDF